MSAGPRTVLVQQAFERGLSHHQSGRLAEAEGIYHQILAQHPDHAEALHMLGVVSQQLGRGEKAVELIGRAIALQPRVAAYHMNLGVALAGLNRPQDAIEAYRRAILLRPEHADTHCNLGIVFFDTGRLEEAVKCFDRAAAIRPDFADAHLHRGDALGRMRKWPEAVTAYRRSLEIRPNFARTLQHLGEALQAINRFDEAIACYRQTLAIQAGGSDLYNNLGHCLYKIGQLDEAILAYRQAIVLRSNDHLALSNLGNALFHQGKIHEAVGWYERCIAVSPDFPEAYNNLGNALWALGRMDDSIAVYRKALELRPDYVNAMSNLAGDLKDTGRLEEAFGYYDKIQRIEPDNAGLHSNYIYALNYLPDATPGKILHEQQRWDLQHVRPLANLIQPHANNRSPDRRLKIGYVSADLRKHVVGWNLLPILEKHDHRTFEIFCYSNVINADAMTGRIKAHCDQWRIITGLDDPRTADLIRQDGIDILIDLSMHSAGNRLLVFARKPAPIQMTYLGYCGATGISAMDYRFSDPYLDSPDTEKFYKEKTIYLPRSYWCYRPGGEAPNPAAQNRGYITFGCLNNFAKVSLPAQKLWSEILNQVKDSHLLLHSQPGKHLDELKDRFAAWGIDPNRLEFVSKQPWEQYIKSYEQMDIALDPFPYGGGITTCDALWMGVPVITLIGETSVGRAGKSILSNVGLPELIARTPEQYTQIAIDLAGDLPRLKDLRTTLREKMSGSPLMDAGQFTRDLEAMLRQAWREWCEN